jgi:outer membrane immunogenic protein
MRLIKLGMLAVTSVVVVVGSASAADLPVRRDPAPAVYSWNGLYWGVNVGYGWGSSDYDAVLTGIGPASRSEKMDGVIGGVQSGYNYQFGNWVLGFETDFQLSAQKGGATFPGAVAPTTITTDEKLAWFGTSRTRVGFLATPNFLFYGTGGIAYGQIKDNATIATPGIGSFTARFKDVKAGWTAGGGIEAAFGGGWSAKIEYLYMDLGKTDHTFGTIGLGVIATESRRVTDNIARIGLNYRWGG